MAENDYEDVELVQKMAEIAILVVGDIMLDRFVYGHVDRISPESPVPILTIERENVMLGGAGNTLSNLINLKCKGKILSIVGDDEAGAQIRAKADHHGIDTEGLLSVSDRPSIVKTRFLAGHQQLLRTDFERVKAITPETEKALLEKAEKLIPSVQALILSDYGKGLLTNGLTSRIIEIAKKAGVPVLVDPKGADYTKYAGADAVTPNRKELSLATGGRAVDEDDEIESAAQDIIRRCRIGAVIATRSRDGMSVVSHGGAVHIRSASDIEVFDVSGAGDTVIATIAACLGCGADLVQAAALANLAGSIVVAKVGTAPIRAEELIEAIENLDTYGQGLAGFAARPSSLDRTREAPVARTWEEAKEDVERWKARGLSVGFTNGCFDIIHPGHVRYLNAARHRCDRLVVGLNVDSSVKLLKGDDRPVHDEQARAAVIAALGSVDLVVFFGAKKAGDDNTACDLLKILQPDLYFKGGDYTVEQIPEAPTVITYGGTVEVLDISEGHSTTASIKKIKAGRAA